MDITGVVYFIGMIAGLLGVYITWRDTRWFWALLVFILPYAGLIVCIAYLAGYNLPVKIFGAYVPPSDPPTTV